MLNNRKDSKYKPTFTKKASHGIQTAKIKTVEINSDKNDNAFLNIILDCETGEYNHRILKPLKSLFLPRNAEVTDTYAETLDTVYWEACEKLLDQLYMFVKLFDSTGEVDEEGYITDNFLQAYKDFVLSLKSGVVTVTKENVSDFGFKKARRKMQRTANDGHEYTSYEMRVVGKEKDTWAEETGNPVYAYEDMIGEKVADFESIDFWNSFFAFIFQYFAKLRKENLLDKEFVVKLIRVESPEYEKDLDGKNLLIDGKKQIKTIYYNVGIPTSQWFKDINNEKFDLKFSKAELEVIQKYDALRNTTNSEIDDTLPM